MAEETQKACAEVETYLQQYEAEEESVVVQVLFGYLKLMRDIAVPGYEIWKAWLKQGAKIKFEGKGVNKWLKEERDRTTVIDMDSRHAADSTSDSESFEGTHSKEFRLWRREDLVAKEDEWPIKEELRRKLHQSLSEQGVMDGPEEEMMLQFALDDRRRDKKAEISRRESGWECVCASVAESARRGLPAKEWCVICE